MITCEHWTIFCNFLLKRLAYIRGVFSPRYTRVSKQQQTYLCIFFLLLHRCIYLFLIFIVRLFFYAQWKCLNNRGITLYIFRTIEIFAFNTSVLFAHRCYSDVDSNPRKARGTARRWASLSSTFITLLFVTLCFSMATRSLHIYTLYLFISYNT